MEKIHEGELQYNLKFKAWRHPISILFEETWAKVDSKEEFNAIFIPEVMKLLRAMYD